jgi:hypothetical protein
VVHAEVFDVVDAGQGRWDIRLHNTPLIEGQVWRTAEGFALRDVMDRRVGTFPTLDDALRVLCSTVWPAGSGTRWADRGGAVA